MRKAIAAAMVIILLCSAAAGCGQKKEEGGPSGEWTPLTVTDDLGREVTLETKPEKAAILLGSFAETWILAGGDICATVHDSWDDYDLDLDETVVKNLGSHGSVSMELLFEAKPDIIIADGIADFVNSFNDEIESKAIILLLLRIKMRVASSNNNAS